VSALVLDGVARTFAGVRGGPPTVALLPTTLEVADNDFITILGPSGCGKSTLLRIVAGLDAPSQGRVLLDGVPVAGPGRDRGMVFQSYTLFPWLTIEENIRFGLREQLEQLAYVVGFKPADKFDQLAAFQNFLIVPLTFLAGVFYSIHSLPPFWQALSHFNPFFYMIDGFRFGFFGLSDVPPAISLAVVAASAAILALVALALLTRGWKLRH
jgi:ABC transporter/ABC-2 type transporter